MAKSPVFRMIESDYVFPHPVSIFGNSFPHVFIRYHPHNMYVDTISLAIPNRFNIRSSNTDYSTL